jgi:hypothetical protein
MTDPTGLGFRIMSKLLGAIGLPNLIEEARMRKLDGLVSVWHPSFN